MWGDVCVWYGEGEGEGEGVVGGEEWEGWRAARLATIIVTRKPILHFLYDFGFACLNSISRGGKIQKRRQQINILEMLNI